MNKQKEIDLIRFIRRYLRRTIDEISKNPNKNTLERLEQRSIRALNKVDNYLKENNSFEEDFKDLKEVITMRLSLNEGYSSQQINEMIDMKIIDIITKYQEQP